MSVAFSVRLHTAPIESPHTTRRREAHGTELRVEVVAREERRKGAQQFLPRQPNPVRPFGVSLSEPEAKPRREELDRPQDFLRALFRELGPAAADPDVADP